MSRNWTEEELRQVERNRQQPWTDKVPVAESKPENKYHTSAKEARTADGIVFDSKKECQHYQKLKLLEQAGNISNLQMQVPFELQEGFKKGGKKYRPIRYIADFTFLEMRDGVVRKVIQDCKGFRLPVYSIKRKLFERRYPLWTIEEV